MTRRDVTKELSEGHEEPERRFNALPALGDADGFVLDLAHDGRCFQRDGREL